MDEHVTQTPVPTGELKGLVDKANEIYLENFDSKVWFGRCIFLSWYCERGTCTFCFRSTNKHKIQHPQDAKRSLAGVLAEALVIRACGWRIEFLTGGYGIYEFDEMVRFAKLCHQALGEKIWLNLGTLSNEDLDKMKPYVEGVVSSMETLEPKLHNTVCPDKPMEPYFEMMEKAKEKGFKQSITLVIGLGEKKEDYSYVKDLLAKYEMDRVTVYALRPVGGTEFTKGPKPEDVAWWIAKIRNDFPKIEIIAGSAVYRIPELSLFLKAGANAFTKLPATNIFNTSKGLMVEEEVKKAGREFVSKFATKNLENDFDFDNAISKMDLTDMEKLEVREKVDVYLKTFDKNKSKEL